MPGQQSQTLLVYNGITASVANTDAVRIPLLGVKRATIFMTTDDNWPNTTSLVEVSADGAYWVVYNKLISNVTNTNANDLTRVATVACNNTTAVAALDLTSDCPAFMRIFPTRTAGTMSLYVVLEYN